MLVISPTPTPIHIFKKRDNSKVENIMLDLKESVKKYLDHLFDLIWFGLIWSQNWTEKINCILLQEN